MMMLKIQHNISLKSYTTLHLPVQAKYFVEITSIDELQELFHHPLFQEKKVILGGGANILFTKDFDGLVIKIALKGKHILSEDEHEIRIQVAAGESRPEFVTYCTQHHYAGIENLAGIPGNVGTTPVSNIGAYGMEIKDRIIEVQGYDLEDQTFHTFSAEECHFVYRGSIFKKELSSRFVITAVVFSLIPRNVDYLYNLNYPDLAKRVEEERKNPNDLSLADISQKIKEIRKRKLPDPEEIGTAGSFFANPIIDQKSAQDLLLKFPNLKTFPCDDPQKVKCSAGQLIDLAWLKGVFHGKVGMSPQHALILVSQGASAAEITDFAHFVQETVREKFGITLEPEVVFVN